MTSTPIHRYLPEDFHKSKASFFYPKAISETLHPDVQRFIGLPLEQLWEALKRLYPKSDPQGLYQVLTYEPRHLFWAGADLLPTENAHGVRSMTLLELNSCPSGQKSMPYHPEISAPTGYETMIKELLWPHLVSLRQRQLIDPAGVLGVFYDKNPMEASGYAAAMAYVCQEPVYLVPWHNVGTGQGFPSFIKVDDTGQVWIHPQHPQEWVKVSLAMRYVTQAPWNRLPIHSPTLLFNPLAACLGGGRNKLMAAQAYQAFNEDWQHTGLHIQTPKTLMGIHKEDIPAALAEWGGRGVVKVPYANAGQGVYTILTPPELRAFMEQEDFAYELYLVQELIPGGGMGLSQPSGLFQRGAKIGDPSQVYAMDLRIMGYSTSGAGQVLSQLKPCALYGRRAHTPMSPQGMPHACVSSWLQLGTNLSTRQGPHSWTTDTDRLLLANTRGFSHMGLSYEDVLIGFLQWAMALQAIDTYTHRIWCPGQPLHLSWKRFTELNPDRGLIKELARGGFLFLHEKA